MEALEKATLPTPPLAGGDQLTRHEFERRYRAMPRVKKAELVGGTVFMSSPLRFRSHSEPHGCIIGWLATYAAATPHVEFGDNATVRLGDEDELQPDALLRIETTCGGTSRISEDDYLEGPPELIVEVAASSAAYDLHQKKQACRRHGVKEYVVWQVFEKRIDWFVLEGASYVPQAPDAEGRLRSRIFGGLHLAVQALLKGDLAAVLGVARQGTEAEEHAAFVRRLRQRRG